MWKCKKCGERIQGVLRGYIDIDINGNGIVGTEDEVEVVRYGCEGCECSRIIKFGNIEELKKFAEWEEEDERD